MCDELLAENVFVAAVNDAFRHEVYERRDQFVRDAAVAEDQDFHHPLAVKVDAGRIVSIAEVGRRSCVKIISVGQSLVDGILLCSDDRRLLVLLVCPLVAEAWGRWLSVFEEHIVSRHVQESQRGLGRRRSGS